jgi:cysteine synthase
MSDYVEVRVDDRTILVVEASDLRTGPVVEAGRVRDLANQAATSFGGAVEALTSAASSVITRAREMEKIPDEVAVEFVIQLAAEAGVVVAKSSATANMTITFTWTSTAE